MGPRTKRQAAPSSTSVFAERANTAKSSAHERRRLLRAGTRFRGRRGRTGPPKFLDGCDGRRCFVRGRQRRAAHCGSGGESDLPPRGEAAAPRRWPTRKAGVIFFFDFVEVTSRCTHRRAAVETAAASSSSFGAGRAARSLSSFHARTPTATWRAREARVATLVVPPTFLRDPVRDGLFGSAAVAIDKPRACPHGLELLPSNHRRRLVAPGSPRSLHPAAAHVLERRLERRPVRRADERSRERSLLVGAQPAARSTRGDFPPSPRAASAQSGRRGGGGAPTRRRRARR